jgi:hypothetical protein
MRLTAPTILLAAASCAALAPVASADPLNATGVRTYERSCDDGTTYTTYKVGHGAAFISGTDQKFVNLFGTAAQVQDGLLTCTFVQVDGPTKGATSGTLTSKIVP